MSPTRLHAPLHRFVLAWAVMVGGLVAFWSCRPLLGTRAFNFGQLAVILGTWKVASLLCLPPRAWARFTPLRLLAYCIWIGMQPRQFLVGERTAANAPIPTVAGFVLNATTGAVLLWLLPRVLPLWSPWVIRFWIALVGFSFLFLVARLDFWALVFRAMGFAVEKLWDCPIAATTLGDFWGRRWNRIVPGFLREVVFVPVARRAGAKVALLAVFLYSGMYHEGVSFMARSGYGGPTLYFLLQCLGIAIENTRPGAIFFAAASGCHARGHWPSSSYLSACSFIRALCTDVSCRCWWPAACRDWNARRMSRHSAPAGAPPVLSPGW